MSDFVFTDAYTKSALVMNCILVAYFMFFIIFNDPVLTFVTGMIVEKKSLSLN